MSGNELLINYYIAELLSVKQAFSKRIPVLAKPLLLLSTLDAIDQSLLQDNRIGFTSLINFYKKAMDIYGGSTPMQYPFYFLSSDGFWHLQWKTEPTRTKSPSAKFIRENIEYAYLDNALWDLLQDAANRERMREAIVRHFFPDHTAASAPPIAAELATPYGISTNNPPIPHIEATKKATIQEEQTIRFNTHHQ